MSVRKRDDGVIALEGDGGLEDAEPLLLLLSKTPGAAVDWSDCAGAHAAILQILMVSGAALFGTPENTYLRNIVGPALKRYSERGFHPVV